MGQGGCYWGFFEHVINIMEFQGTVWRRVRYFYGYFLHFLGMTNPDKIALPASHLCSRNMSCMKGEHKRLGKTRPLWHWLKGKDQICERSVLSLQSRKAQTHLGCGKRGLKRSVPFYSPDGSWCCKTTLYQLQFVSRSQRE